MSKDTGGPAFVCSVCDEEATMRQGNQRLCDKHYRFGSMRSKAKADGKTVPTRWQLESLTNPDMKCPDCGRLMNWRQKDGSASVASLQHYRDGSLGIVCLSCNTRHASMPGDSYRETPKHQKLCPSCEEIKDGSEFSLDRSRSGEIQRKSFCRSCANKSAIEWKGKNRDKYNEYQRQYRAKRKASGNPVDSGT